MGKHDMKEPKGTINPETRFSWEPMPDDFYKARITTLEKENLALREKIGELEKSVGTYELVVDNTDEMHTNVVCELQDTIMDLQEQIYDLKEALVRAALREV